MRILTLPGVLKPPSDCWLLSEVMRAHRLASQATVLDVFTGSGALAVVAALDGAREVTAVDLSRRSTINAALNARLNRVRIRALCGDLFAPVATDRFDLIVANPPYVPSERSAPPARGLARAWEGGLDGRAVLARLCSEAADHLNPGGSVLIVHSSLSGEEATVSDLRASGLKTELLARRRGPLGPIAAARSQMLESRGLLKPGEREEDLLVIRGIG